MNKRKADKQIITLIVISAMSGLIALAAFAYSITAFRSDVAGRLHRLQVSRQLSVEDTCGILRVVIRKAYGSDMKGANALISSAGLTHCKAHAYRVVTRPPVKR